MCEYGSTGSVLTSNTFGPDGLLSRLSSTQGHTFYACDERGDVSQRTGAAGAVVGSDLYDGYGARQGTAAVQPDPFGYGGQWGYYTDTETGLVLCTHRFYDPQAGRFVTRDPIGYDGGVNLYGYTQNNPVNWIDPLGFMGGPGKGGPIPGWHPPAKTPTPDRPGWHSGKPGKGRCPDYYAFNFSFPLGGLSGNGQIEVDRYGNWYVGGGGDYGVPPFSGSLVEGTLDKSTTPSESYLKNWLSGGGVNVTGAYGVSVGKTWSTDGDGNFVSSSEYGLGTPQLGGSAIYTLPLPTKR